MLVHGPIRASWLNQIEIYFSVLERKALRPNDFPSLAALAQRILGFQCRYQSIEALRVAIHTTGPRALLRKLDDSLLAA